MHLCKPVGELGQGLKSLLSDERKDVIRFHFINATRNAFEVAIQIAVFKSSMQRRSKPMRMEEFYVHQLTCSIDNFLESG